MDTAGVVLAAAFWTTGWESRFEVWEALFYEKVLCLSYSIFFLDYWDDDELLLYGLGLAFIFYGVAYAFFDALRVL